MGNATSLIPSVLNSTNKLSNANATDDILGYIDKDIFFKIADHTNKEVLFSKFKLKEEDQYINKQKFIDFTTTTTDTYFCYNRVTATSKNIKDIITSLEAKGIKVSPTLSNDRKNTDSLQSTIKNAIDQSGSFLIILTKDYLYNLTNHSKTSLENEFNWNAFEFSYIIQSRGNKRIIPIMLDSSDNDSNSITISNETLPKSLQDIPCIYFTKDQKKNEAMKSQLYDRIIDIIKIPVRIKMEHFLLTSNFSTIPNKIQRTDSIKSSQNNSSEIVINDNSCKSDNATNAVHNKTNDTTNSNNINNDNIVVVDKINSNRMDDKTKLGGNEIAHIVSVRNVTGSRNSIEEKIKNYIKLVKNGDETSKRKSLDNLQNLMYDDNNKSILVNEGGITTCISLLKFGDAYEKQYALKILNSLAINQIHRISISKAGGIRYLMDILRDSERQNEVTEEEDRILVITILGKLAIESTNNIMISIEGIPLFINLLKNNNQSSGGHSITNKEKKQIMLTLIDLLIHNYNNCLVIEQCGGIPLIISIFKNENSNNINLKIAAVLLLCNLIMSDNTSSRDIATLIYNAGCVSMLVSMLQIEGIQMQERKEIILSIGILCIDSESNKNILADEGGISILINLLRYSDSIDEKYNIIEVLSYIATSTKNQIIIRQEGGIPLLMKLIVQEDSQQYPNATHPSSSYILSSDDENQIRSKKIIEEKIKIVKVIKLLASNDENKELLVQLGSIPIIKSLITHKPSNTELATTTIHNISNTTSAKSTSTTNTNTKNHNLTKNIMIDYKGLDENQMILRDTLKLLEFSPYDRSDLKKMLRIKQQSNTSHQEENIDMLQDMFYANMIMAKKIPSYR